ncbi:MAG: ribonuclease HII [Gemmatimonadota bacterium]
MPDTGPESSRLQDPLAYERGFWSRGRLRVAGVDEVGRGPLAGPVVAAAVILPEGCVVEGAADSKRLSAGVREEVASRIRESAFAIGIGAASVREVETLNILVATALAMRRALAGLPSAPEHVVIDGRPVRDLELPHEAVVGGDGVIHSISCASIVAKVCRDRLMHRLALRYPRYGWETNVGYGTPAHLEALRRQGPTPHHRRTFAGVQLELGLEGGTGRG